MGPALFEELVRKHPNYVMGKMNLAHSLLDKGEYRRVEKLFPKPWTPQNLFPGKEIFSPAEIFSFCLIAIRLSLDEEDLESAEQFVELAEKLEDYMGIEARVIDQMYEMISSYQMEQENFFEELTYEFSKSPKDENYKKPKPKKKRTSTKSPPKQIKGPVLYKDAD